MDKVEGSPQEPNASEIAQWRRLRDLFGDAQELPESERGAFLDRELAGEPELRAQLDSFMASAETMGAFLAPRDPAQASPRWSPAPGSRVGAYRLVELLGEGGFGVVYLAEQEQPIRRRVALKLIKPGMDTRQVIARFEAERQALAQMDHPAIAQVFEAGETEAGRPFFAMEYVPGVPITTFCDTERLGIRARLNLFLDVCDAVQHAHQKGVIHRDIKPSNVLVARRDGVPSLKLIDFGIVKATATTPDELTLMTREGMVLGTRGYMSPEQAGAIQAEVDTRSDIYSLGVLLYELLSGEMPFDRARLQRAEWTEAVRIIREEDPPTLTARLLRSGPASTSGQQGERSERVASIADHRATNERALVRELHGELEWITLRSLEKAPDRRYPAASELAADIRRHLANEPVLARAPSTTYRVRKFARRHRVGVAAASLVLFAIVAGGIAATVGLTRAVRAEQTARREAESARHVADFLVELFQTSDPNRSRGETITARTLLAQGTRRIRARRDQDPRIRARLISTLGEAHVSLGLFEEGLSLLREALAASEATIPRDEVEVARQLRGLAAGFGAAGKADSADRVLDQALAMAAAFRTPQPSLVAACFALKGENEINVGRLASADSFATLAIDLCASDAHPDSLQLAKVHLIKARVAHRRYKMEVAEREYLRALELSTRIGSDPNTSTIHSQLALLYSAWQKPELAGQHARLAVRLARMLYPPDHPNIAIALGAEAAAERSKGDYTAAVALIEESVRVLRAGGGREDLLAIALSMAADDYYALGHLDLAIARMHESCATSERVLGRENPRTAARIAGLALFTAKAGRLREADVIFGEALQILERLDVETIYAAEAFAGRGDVCRRLGKLPLADSLYVRALARLDTSEVAVRPYLIQWMAERAYLTAQRGRPADAEAMAKAWLSIARRHDEEFIPARAQPYVLWAAARARTGDLDGANATLHHAVRCGIVRDHLAEFRELRPLESRPDYPRELRQ